MFDFVQEKKRVVQFVLALVILPFAFWGVDSYRKSGNGEAVATVNGDKISAQEFDDALRQQLQRMREMGGPNFDQSFFDKPEVKYSILNSLVSKHLLVSEAHKVGLTVTDEQLIEIISGIAAFQKDGAYSKKQAASVLKEQGMTPLMFQSKVAAQVSSTQLTDSYDKNGYVASTVADKLIHLNEQQLTVSLAKLDVNALQKQVKVADSDIAEYYKKNQSEFQTPERAKVEYVAFSADSLLSQVSVDEAEVKKYFEENLPEFTTQEQRKAAHILISVSAKASDADKQAAMVKAEEVLQKVRKSPKQFSALAKQYSQDPGSAAKGGDLGMFGRGAMVKAFDDAVFSLKVGEISGLVQSDFGFHIIRVSAIKAAKTRPLSKVRGLITQRVKEQKASDMFAELAEKFSNTVYEQSDSLRTASELVKSPIQENVWLSKGQAAAGIWTAKVLQAVFSDDALVNKRNTAAVEVSPNKLLSARVVEHQSASVRPLAEVSVLIHDKLQHQQALALMEKKGNDLLARLQKGEAAKVSWKKSENISRPQHVGLNADLAQIVFKAKTTKLPAYVGMKNTQQGFSLVRIDAVKEVAEIDDAKRNRYMKQVAQITGQELLQAYLAEAKSHAKIELKSFAAAEKR